MKKAIKKLIIFFIMVLIIVFIYSYRLEIAKLIGNMDIKLGNSNFEENINIILNGSFVGNNEEIYTDEEIEQMLKSSEPIIDGEYIGKLDNYYYNQLDTYAKVLYKAILDNADELKKEDYEIKVSNVLSNIMKEADGKDKINLAFQNAWSAFRLDHPEIFYINVENIYLTTKTTTYGKKVTYEFFLNSKKNGDTIKAYTDSYEKEIKEKKNQIISNTSKYNNLAKVLYIHNWIVDNAEYDVSMRSANNSNIYGLMIEKKAVCEGYAKAFKYLLDELNIPCVIICGMATDDDGNVERHAWNAVYLEGKWYAIDTTWDDPIIIGNGKLTNNLKYKYFLNGSTEISKNHEQNGRLSDDINEIEFKYPQLSNEDYKIK